MRAESRVALYRLVDSVTTLSGNEARTQSQNPFSCIQPLAGSKQVPVYMYIYIYIRTHMYLDLPLYIYIYELINSLFYLLVSCYLLLFLGLLRGALQPGCGRQGGCLKVRFWGSMEVEALVFGV